MTLAYILLGWFLIGMVVTIIDTMVVYLFFDRKRRLTFKKSLAHTFSTRSHSLMENVLLTIAVVLIWPYTLFCKIPTELWHAYLKIPTESNYSPQKQY